MRTASAESALPADGVVEGEKDHTGANDSLRIYLASHGNEFKREKHYKHYFTTRKVQGKVLFTVRRTLFSLRLVQAAS